MVEQRQETNAAAEQPIEVLRETQMATLNILEDFNSEKGRLEQAQRAVLNILDDFDSEKGNLQTTQKATFNILEDFNAEKTRLEDTQRAVLNILDDFDSEKGHLQTTQKATFNILEDFNSEKGRLGQTQRAVLNILEDLNQSNEGLQKAQSVLELRVEERTAELLQSNAQLRAEMEERRKAEDEATRSLREKEVLLKEVHHRVKNNLQIIHSMLNLQLPYIKDPLSIETFKESQNRIFTMALIHEKLYQSESLARIDLAEYVRSLVGNLFLSYGVAERVTQLKTDVENVSLDVDTVVPCALIINELVTNSLKHGFPETWRGARGTAEIRVAFHQNGPDRFLLFVGDNGVGLPAGFQIEGSATLGLRLVTVLTRQLRGALTLGSGPGAEFTIRFQAPR